VAEEPEKSLATCDALLIAGRSARDDGEESHLNPDVVGCGKPRAARPRSLSVPDEPAGERLRWGRADRVAITHVTGDGIEAWKEYDVGWNALHDAGTEGSHHAGVARFLQDHHVEAVVANHMGMPMMHMLERMGVKVWLGAMGDARSATAVAISSQSS
jgi:predicted Fe-Mo cluster-binding NifX family protein